MGCSNSYNTNTYYFIVAKDEEICLEMHNQKRYLHGSPPLELNEQLCDLAKKCAVKLSKNENNINYIYKEVFLGQNIYIYKGEILNIREIINEWYEEINNYKEDLNKFHKNAYHFTQMIWKETKEIGFGFKEKGHIFYVVVLYYPPGNTFGEFKRNILIKK